VRCREGCCRRKNVGDIFRSNVEVEGRAPRVENADILKNKNGADVYLRTKVIKDTTMDGPFHLPEEINGTE